MLRAFIAAVMALALVESSVNAQPAPPVAKGDSAAAVLNGILADAERDFVDVAEAMPASQFDFLPTGPAFADARSFSGTIKHVIWANYSLANKISGSTQPIDKAAIESMSDRAQILEQLHKSFIAAEKAIDGLTPENMLDGGSGRAARLGSAAFLTAHTMAHGGELVEYLRMKGVSPPKSWN